MGCLRRGSGRTSRTFGLSCAWPCGPLAETCGGDPKDDDLVHMLERVAIRLATEAWTAPMWWATFEDRVTRGRARPMARRWAYRIAVELLSDYSSPTLVERVESLSNLRRGVRGCGQSPRGP